MNEIITNLENLSSAQKERVGSLIDILYVTNIVGLYIFSLLYPLFGIIYGVILYNTSLVAPTRKIARICIILGAINILLTLGFFFIIFAIKNFFSQLSPLYL
ncbi:MAG: hypothetical protein N2166_02460 [candidate division WOR-3 bacterium]|nr:hypothetical protein [candidate division WOR-3 bacterium]